MVCNQTVCQSVAVKELKAHCVFRKVPDQQDRAAMLNGSLKQSLGSGQEGFDSSGELCILKDRLYLASLPAPPDAKNKTYHLTLSKKMRYIPFCADFGPYNLGEWLQTQCCFAESWWLTPRNLRGGCRKYMIPARRRTLRAVRPGKPAIGIVQQKLIHDFLIRGRQWVEIKLSLKSLTTCKGVN